MKMSDCLDIAAEWVRLYEAPRPGFVGAYVGGSTALLAPDDQIPAGSDMDVYVVMEGELPQKRKFDWRGALLEVSYMAAEVLFAPGCAAADYHLANSLRCRLTLADTGGRIAQLQRGIAESFTRPECIARRRDHALSRVEGGLSLLDPKRDLPDFVLSWLFPTGVTTHAVLVACLRNPTVRLRYLRAGEALRERGLDAAHERLLELAGFDAVTPECARGLTAAMEPLYDRAAELGRTHFLYSDDVSPQSRATAIDATYRLIDAGAHREVMFWIITTYTRAMRILLTDAPAEYERFLPDFMEALSAIGRGTPDAACAAAQRTLKALPWLRELTDSLIGAV